MNKKHDRRIDNCMDCHEHEHARLMCIVVVLSIMTTLTSCDHLKEPCQGRGNVHKSDTVEARQTPGMELGEELLSAIESADIARVNFCLLAGVDANYKGNRGVTPLGVAISDLEKGPNTSIVMALLKGGADPQALWGNCGTTPFFSLMQNSTSSRVGSVVLSNQVACVRLLLKHGADPNRKQGLFRKSSLEYAVMREGDIELVKALVEGGAVVTDETINDAKDANVKRYLMKSKGNVID